MERGFGFLFCFVRFCFSTYVSNVVKTDIGLLETINEMVDTVPNTGSPTERLVVWSYIRWTGVSIHWEVLLV